MTFKECLAKWRDYLLIDKKYGENTIKTYDNNLTSFMNFVGEDKDVIKITKDDVINYLTKLKQNKIKDYTISNHITSLKQFFRFLELEQIIYISPVKAIPQPRLTRKLPSVLSIKEVSNLLDIEIKNKYDARNKAMLEVLYSSGLRISELLSLKVDDISFSSDSIRVIGKGSKERFVPLGDYAIAALKTYLNTYREKFIKKPTDYLFLSNKGSPLTRQRMSIYVKELASKKNIKTDFSLHTLRHSFASHMLQNGADLRSIQEMLGHSSISTTQIYTHIANQELADKYKMFHPHA